MSIGDFIQLAIAIIAGVGSIFAFLNIKTNNKLIDLQQRQWEHMHVPVFRITHIKSFNKKSFSFVIENTNNMYYQIEQVIFSVEDIIITTDFHGSINTSKTRGSEVIEKKEYNGFVVTLTLPDSQFYTGVIQLMGEDSLGNDFKVNSKVLKFKDYKLINHLYVSQTYLQKVPSS